MITRVLFLATLLFTASCTHQNSVQYADRLKGCLTQEDVFLLNEACHTFESQLAKRYKNQELGRAYKTFLFDIQTMSVPPDFFVTAENREVLIRMKKTKTFDKIWTKMSYDDIFEDMEVYAVDGKQEEAEPESFTLNPNGAYLDCLMKVSEHEAMADFLEAIRTIPGISPGLTAGVLKESLTQEDFDNGLIRLIIAIGFYYELALMLDFE